MSTWLICLAWVEAILNILALISHKLGTCRIAVEKQNSRTLHFFSIDHDLRYFLVGVRWNRFHDDDDEQQIWTKIYICIVPMIVIKYERLSATWQL